MIQGTDSGFCDYRYHPMYYSNDPTSETAWLDESRDKIQGYVSESKKTWMNGTDGGECVFIFRSPAPSSSCTPPLMLL